MSDEPRWRIIFVRWASPPDSVPDGRSSERYPSPISTNESRRWRRPASSGATDGSSRPRTHSARSLICIAHASAMLIPLILDDRAASLSRVPPQSGHAVKVTARSTNARMWGWSDAASFESIDFRSRGTSPSYVMLMPLIFTFVGSRYRKSRRSCSV